MSMDNLPPVGSMVRWAICGRGTCLPREVVMYREFPNGVTYALLVWTAYGHEKGRPLCEWVTESRLSTYYEEVEL